jgi:hypothetical protein
MTVFISAQDSSIDDTYIYSNAPTTNYGTDAVIKVGYSSSTSQFLRGLLRFDYTTGTNPPDPGSGSVIVNSGTITVYCDTYTTTKTMVLYQCLKKWVEGSATWNTYDGTNNWGTAGAQGTQDYNSPGIGSVSVSAVGSYDIAINAAGLAAIQGWINAPATNYGFVIRNTVENTNFNNITSSEGGTAANRPKITLDYTGNQYGSGYTLILNTT